MRLFFGLIFLFIGIGLCFTVIGAIAGIPLLAIGIWLIYSWQTKRLKKVIKSGIVEASRETAQLKNQTSTSIEKEKDPEQRNNKVSE